MLEGRLHGSCGMSLLQPIEVPGWDQGATEIRKEGIFTKSKTMVEESSLKMMENKYHEKILFCHCPV